MVTQAALFYEDFDDALKYSVQMMGGFEAVGVEMFPEKTRKAAGNWLSDCLNPNRSAKLSGAQAMLLMKMGRHAGVMAAFDQLGIETDTNWQPVVPKSQRTRLMEESRALMDRAIQKQKEADLLDSVDAVQELRAAS